MIRSECNINTVLQPSWLLLFTRYVRHVCSSSVVLAVLYGRSPSVWAGRAPYFCPPWSRWIRCGASSCSRSAVFTLLGPTLGGKLARMIVYRILSKCLDHIPRCLPRLALGVNRNTEETPKMRKPRNFAKSRVYFQHSQSLCYLLL